MNKESESVRLITMDGKCIELELPEGNHEEIYDALKDAYATQGLFLADNYGVKAKFMEWELNTIDFHKIIGEY